MATPVIQVFVSKEFYATGPSQFLACLADGPFMKRLLTLYHLFGVASAALAEQVD